jgi:glycerol kinase
MDHATDRRQLVRSALEAIAFRVREIIDAMVAAGVCMDQVDVDGGLTQCDALMQIQADVLRMPVSRRRFTESTALGAGYFAAIGSRLWSSPSEIPISPNDALVFHPRRAASDAYEVAFGKWKRACSAVVEMGDAGLFLR